MPIDNVTTNYGWELPDASNPLSHDVIRIIDAINAIDTELANHPTTTAMNAAINTAIGNLVNAAPGTLDTLKELADALGDDPNFATTMTNSLAGKLGLGGGILTGLLTLAAAGVKLQAGADPTTDGVLTLVSGALHYMRGGTVYELADTGSAQTLAAKTLTSPTINTPTISNAAAGATMKDSTGTGQLLGFMGIPAKAAKTAAYQLTIDDNWFEVPTNSNVTVPDNSSVAFPVGAMVSIRNTGSSAITVGMAGTDSLTQEGTTNTGTRTLAGNGIALLRKISATAWLIMGSHLT
jgi:hypothetical protein